MRKSIRAFLLLAVDLAVCWSAVSVAYGQAKAPSRGVVDPDASSRAAAPRGNYYALVIGIQNYQSLPKLETPLHDADEVADVLARTYGFKVQILPDASRHQIFKALSEYKQKLQENDSFLIYYAGHGLYEAGARKGYWLPVDAERDDPTNWIIAEEVTSSFRELAARHVLVVSDSCYAGMLTRSISSITKPLDPTQYLEKMSTGKSRNLMASGGDEPVADEGAEGHSVFAYAFLQGLKGIDQNAFTGMDLFNTFVQRRVVGGSDQIPQYVPIPGSGDTEGDFVFYRLSPTKNLVASSGDVRSSPPSVTGRAHEKENSVTPPVNDDLALAKQKVASRAYAAALPLFQKAAEQGNAEAMAYVGLYFDSLERQYAGQVKSDSEAASWYRKSAEAGSPKGMCKLGSMYQGGRGVEEDSWQAMRWYRKSADAGEVTAMRNLGRMYAFGNGMETDYPQALAWLTKASDAGDADSMVILGRMYADGRGVPANEAEAANWYGKAVSSNRKAADAGDAMAMMRLASAYDSGQGVEKDPAHALNWMRRAADTGDPRAAISLAIRYQSDKGGSKDLAQSAFWYRKAADEGDALAMVRLARIYETGEGVTKNLGLALDWYRRAAAGKSLEAMVELGRRYQEGAGVERSETEARSWFDKAAQEAEAGGAGRMMKLATVYEEKSGDVLKPDPVRAFEWYKKAAEAGNSNAMLDLGGMYEHGRGTDRDPAQAVSWYRRAANAGNTTGMLDLGRMYLAGTGVEKDDAQAQTWFRKVAASGNARALMTIGRAYEGVQDYTNAASWYRRAVTLNYASAMTSLGSLYQRGLGVPRDLSEAANWYKKAVDAGDSNASTRLQALNKERDSIQNKVTPLSQVTTTPKGPDFSGTWIEINARDPQHPRKLILQQDGSKVVFAGFRLALSGGSAMWSGPQGCALRFQHSGYKYGDSDAAGTVNLKMSLKGPDLVYENTVNWQLPCDGHAIGTERNVSEFHRQSATRSAAEPSASSRPQASGRNATCTNLGSGKFRITASGDTYTPMGETHALLYGVNVSVKMHRGF